MDIKNLLKNLNEATRPYEDNISKQALDALDNIAEEILSVSLKEQKTEEIQTTDLLEAMYRAYAKGFTEGLKQAAKLNEE